MKDYKNSLPNSHLYVIERYFILMKDKKCWAPYDIIMIIAYFFICFPILLSYGCPLYQCVIYFLIANIL